MTETKTNSAAAAFEQMVREAVEGAVEAAIDDAVEEAIDKYDFEKYVEKHVERAVENYDLEDVVKETISNVGLEEQVEKAVEAAIDDADLETMVEQTALCAVNDLLGADHFMATVDGLVNEHFHRLLADADLIDQLAAALKARCPAPWHRRLGARVAGWGRGAVRFFTGKEV